MVGWSSTNLIYMGNVKKFKKCGGWLGEGKNARACSPCPEHLIPTAHITETPSQPTNHPSFQESIWIIPNRKKYKSSSKRGEKLLWEQKGLDQFESTFGSCSQLKILQIYKFYKLSQAFGIWLCSHRLRKKSNIKQMKKNQVTSVSKDQLRSKKDP